jgi:hypothetical protein
LGSVFGPEAAAPLAALAWGSAGAEAVLGKTTSAGSRPEAPLEVPAPDLRYSLSNTVNRQAKGTPDRRPKRTPLFAVSDA